jgi:arylformamidase
VSRLIDVSHEVEQGMVTYKGLPAPVMCDFLSREASKGKYAEGVTFSIGRIDMVANTGTYVDSPFHRYADKQDLATLPLERLAAVPGLVVRAPQGLRALGPELFAGRALWGRAVLVHTGWDRHWRTEPYFSGHPYLTKAAVEALAAGGAALVGIDSFNIDDTADAARPAHSILLGAGIPIAEHLCRLQDLPDEGFEFHAAPVKVKAFGTFPVRAYGVLR